MNLFVKAFLVTTGICAGLLMAGAAMAVLAAIGYLLAH